MKQPGKNGQGHHADQHRAQIDYRITMEQGLLPASARNLAQFEEVVPGLGTSRRVVRWAWDDDCDWKHRPLENDGKGYVVVILTDKLEEGTTCESVAAVKFGS